MQPVGNFISTVGPSLKELEIALINTAILSAGVFAGKYTFYGFPWPIVSDVCLDFFEAQSTLSTCTNLRKLVLCSTKGFLARSGSESESFSWAVTFLRQIPSPSVEELVLLVSNEDIEFLRSKEWEQAMELILSNRFAALKDLLVRV